MAEIRNAQARRERLEQLIRAGADAETMAAAIVEATAGPGACRIDDGKHGKDDFPDLVPVLTTNGLQWCCSFGHCSKPIQGLA